MSSPFAAANAPFLPGFGAAAPLGRRHPNPVHAGSVRHEVRWTRADKRSATKLWHQARLWDRRSHEPGRHGGRLGHAALQVLHCLIFDFTNWITGRLDPSYEAIAAKANMARSTVASALQRLRRLGVLHWLRRCTEEVDEAGRYLLRQISNAYAVLPPSQWRVVGLVPSLAPVPEPGTWGEPQPVPDTIASAAAAPAEGERIALLETDPGDRLAAALARLGRRLSEGGQA
ncbi:MAG: hypothetical protein ACRC67_15675 [Inquilinus sp.]|uniref:hypothetical protein n=1 Tax=Inquilinus sp. TaxID=1932117 RepID=UPI003F3A08D5